MTLCPGVRFIHLRLWSRLNRGRVFFICVYFSCFFRDKFEQIFEGQGTSTGKNPTFLEIIHILCKYCNYCKGWKIRTWNYFGYLCSRVGMIAVYCEISNALPDPKIPHQATFAQQITLVLRILLLKQNCDFYCWQNDLQNSWGRLEQNFT